MLKKHSVNGTLVLRKNTCFLVIHDEHLLNATYYSPDIDEQALDSTFGILGPGISGISGGVADTSPTHINQLNTTAHHQTANSHVDVTGSVGRQKNTAKRHVCELISIFPIFGIIIGYLFISNV